MRRRLAIGDVHGCVRTLKYLLFHKICINKEDRIFCIGDLIDRGPDSKGVIDEIIELKAKGYYIDCLRGNHEQMMLDSENSEEQMYMWIRNGGDNTLESFCTDSFQNFEIKYKTFFSLLPYYIVEDDYILVHAGLNMNNANIFEDKRAMLWEREFHIDEYKLNGKRIIHGHTPVPKKEIIRQANSLCINIDGGCVFNDVQYFGNLVCFDLDKNKFIFQKNID